MGAVPLEAELRDALKAAQADAAADGRGFHTVYVARRLLRLESVYRLAEAAAVRAARSALDALAEKVGADPVGVDAALGQVRQMRDALGAPRVTARMMLAVVVTPGVLTDPLSVEAAGVVVAAGLDRDRLLQGEPVPPRSELDFRYGPLGYGIDLTAMAMADYWPRNPAGGRTVEVEAVLDVLAGGYSAVITGLPGVGKSTLAAGVAWTVAKGLHGGARGDLRIVSIDQRDLVAGTGVRGALEERVGKLVEHLKSDPHVIPFFDELHAILGAADESARKIGELLKGPLASRAVRCIGATTDHEYVRYILKDGALNRRFQPIQLHEPTRDEALEVLRQVRPDLAAGPPRLELTDEALAAAVDLSIEHYRDEALPSKAIRLLRTAVGRQRRLALRDPSAARLTADAVAGVVADFRQVPRHSLTGDRVRRLLGPDGARARLAARVVGQDRAIDELVTWLALNADGCTDPAAPIGRFLFLGRPGCGKTELARAVAAELGRDGGAIIEKPMAQYRTESAPAQFMGAAAGYIGYGETNTVFSQVRMRPYAVVVLDEIDKAHESLMPILLSVLDGYAEDGQGVAVDFSKCVFILTSNALAADGLTADQLRAMAALPDEELRARLLDRKWFTAPFLDRLDRVVFFNPLDREGLGRILRLKLAARRAASPRAVPDGFEARADDIVNETVERTDGSGRDLNRILLRRLREAKQRQWQTDLGGQPPVPPGSVGRRKK
jgi:ATP-dependent Clp protease ATP-binding subunit ClpC